MQALQLPSDGTTKFIFSALKIIVKQPVFEEPKLRYTIGATKCGSNPDSAANKMRMHAPDRPSLRHSV